MLNAKLVLVLELLKLFLWCFLVMLLVLGRWLNTLVKVFTNEQDLAVFMINILGLDLGPCQTTELLNDPILD
jgi:hypothetical protein